MSDANTVLESCESTNDLAKTLGETGASHGTWISAKSQTLGRGRLGRKWESAEGNLFFSMVVRPPKYFPVSATPLCAALALYDSIQSLKKIPALKIKWPNDLVLQEGKKILKTAGILCEGVGSSHGSFIVIGVGANCANAPQVDQATAALEIPVDRLRTELISRLRKIFDQPWEIQKPHYLESALLTPGTAISWVSNHDPEKIETGVVEAYGEFGELCVLSSDKKPRRLYSEEVKIRL